jgi:hypothetical protein
MGKNQSASNLTNIIKQDANGNITFVSGSTTLMSVSSSGAIATTGNVAGTASYASNAELLDGLDSTVFAITGSNTFTGIQTVNSNLIVTGSITAQTLVVQTVSSSVIYSSGSNVFGNNIANTQVFTGSMNLTGSLTVVTTGTEFQVTSTGVRIGNVIGDTHVVTGSINVSGSGVFVGGITAASLGLNGSIANSADTAVLTIKQSSTTYTNGIYLERGGERNGYHIYIGGSLDALTFRRNYAGTQSDVMSLTRDGNVGVANANPGGTLPTVSPNNGWTYTSRRILEINSTDTNGNAGVFMRRSDLLTGLDLWTDNYFGDSYIDSRWDNAAGSLYFRLRTAGTPFVATRITKGSGTVVVTLGKAGSIWDTTNRGTLEINGDGSAILGFTVGSGERGYLYHGGTQMYLQNNASGGNIYVAASSGGVQLNNGATSWTATSDERLKNINSNIENAIEKLLTLRTVNFSWKSDETNKENLGLIAQDVEAVFPQVIEKNKLNSGVDEQNDHTEYLGVKYTELIPVLVKAIQELKAEIDELKNK